MANIDIEWARYEDPVLNGVYELKEPIVHFGTTLTHALYRGDIPREADAPPETQQCRFYLLTEHPKNVIGDINLDFHTWWPRYETYRHVKLRRI